MKDSVFGCMTWRRNGLVLALCCALLIFVPARMLERNSPAQSATDTITAETALDILQNVDAINQALEKDPEYLKQLATVAFPILHPELAYEQRMKDPAAAAEDAAAFYTILHPAEVQAALERDPEYAQRKAQALRSLGVGNGTEVP